MHELSIAQSIVEMVGERAGDARVHRLTLVIGRLSGVMPDALRFCFDVCTEGTVLEGAVLEIIEPSGRGRCPDSVAVRDVRLRRNRSRRIAGDELRIKEMEMA